jgi:metal-dependent HD superfamily phosphatase/phosphodiesterase
VRPANFKPAGYILRSQKELSIDGKILQAVKDFGLPGRAVSAAQFLLEDNEIQAVQEYANTVSIKRLGYNDHGPVHMRTVALNAVNMMGLLRQAGIKTSLESEECGDFDDSLTAVLFAALLHDLGMAIGRQDHELHSAYASIPIMERLLVKVYPGNLSKQVIVRSVALEGIAGHMGNRTIHSLEAGVVQVADGCDMTKGRARISLALSGGPRVGDIHQYSANSIEEVQLSPGKEKPIRIEVLMSSEVGLFQVEEVLLGKIAASTAKSYIELYALVNRGKPKRYL